ncbi:hypothetical protein GTP55_26375 [Duganella sp. FT109W]|uniref:SGNH/GDSL hydrolase family protein n=1 Tax=Duganella margarita TaxID=2692170 RepID=A0ABW9WRG5_9BURK|nr:hypothetical protein [Duganella margarita]MYN42874.1 hypothetical protein [Duganella margarita]
MIYVVGMSHSIALVNAVAAGDSGVSQYNYTLQSATSFQPVPIKPGMLPGDEMAALVLSGQGWQPLATMNDAGSATRYVQGHPEFTAALDALRPLQENSCILSFVDGNSHSALSALQHPVPYDFVLPGHEDWGMQPGFQPLPPGLIRRHILPYQLNTIAALALMRIALPQARIIHVLPPPPSHAERFLISPEAFGDRVSQFGITPILVRRKYHVMANRIIQQETQSFGIELLEAPRACYDTDGTLLTQYVEGATHGNTAYGALVAEQIRNLF